MDAMDIRWVMVPAVGTLPAYSIRDADYEKEKELAPLAQSTEQAVSTGWVGGWSPSWRTKGRGCALAEGDILGTFSGWQAGGN